MGKKFSKLYNAGLEIREDSDYEEFYVIDKTAADNNFILVRSSSIMLVHLSVKLSQVRFSIPL